MQHRNWRFLSFLTLGSFLAPFSLQGVPLDLDMAWGYLSGAGELKASALAIESKEGEALQAALWPNPELELDFDNISGSKAFREENGLEISVKLHQIFETGGKRHARVRQAQGEAVEASWELQSEE